MPHVLRATLDDFDALCAHLATMHPSRYLTLIEGVTAVFLTGVHGIDDQNVALRLVALVDRLYDAGIPVVASGAKLDTIFSEEMLAGGYRKKYLRATSRLLALTAGSYKLANHDVVILVVGSQSKRPGAVDLETSLRVEALCALVFLVDTQPHPERAPVGGGSQHLVHQCRSGSGAMITRQQVQLGQLHVPVVTANEHGVTDNSAVMAGGEDGAPRIGQILGEPGRRQVGVDERRDVLRATAGGHASGKVRAATAANSSASVTSAVAISRRRSKVPLCEVLAGFLVQ